VLYTALRKIHWREVAVKKIDNILVPTDLSERSLAGVGNVIEKVTRKAPLPSVIDSLGAQRGKA
jgi:hypothetical protein